MITKYFVIFDLSFCLSVIVFADLFKMLMIPNDSLVAMKVVPLIIQANFFRDLYKPICMVRLIKTYIGAYISIVEQ
jgi:hypothetical protein